MTDHIDVPIVANGDWIDAAWINQYIGDNVRAWRQAYTAAGMMAYALDANTLAGLSHVAGGMMYGGAAQPAWLTPPAGLSLVKHNGSLPSYLPKGTAYQFLQMNSSGSDFQWGSTKITELIGGGNQNVAAGTPILWPAEWADDEGWHSLVSNTSRITAPTTGRYRLICGLGLWTAAGGGTTSFLASIRINGTSYYPNRKLVGNDGTMYTMEFPEIIFGLAAGQYVEVYYDSGGIVNMDFSYFGLERVP